MPNGPPEHEEEPRSPEPLSYETPITHFEHPLPPAVPVPVVVIFAFFVGVGIVWVGGAIWYLNIIRIGGSPPPPSAPHWGPVIVFWLILAVASCGVVQLFRAPGRKRFFLAGLLIGVATASLFEGVCFAQP